MTNLISPRILNVLDRIAHPSTTGTDLDNSVAGLRRLLRGEAPSEMLRLPPVPPPSRTGRHRSYDSFKAEIAELREKLKTAEADKATSERMRQHKIESLINQITKLQLRLDATSQADEPKDGCYTRAQIKQIIAQNFDKDHGVLKALVEKNARQRKSGIDIPKITDSLLQKWRKDDRYPIWMVEQLRALTADDVLPRFKWSLEQKNFVVHLVTVKPHLTNQQIADAVYDRFGCRITDSSIRGVLNRAGLLRPKLLC